MALWHRKLIFSCFLLTDVCSNLYNWKHLRWRGKPNKGWCNSLEQLSGPHHDCLQTVDKYSTCYNITMYSKLVADVVQAVALGYSAPFIHGTMQKIQWDKCPAPVIRWCCSLVQLILHKGQHFCHLPLHWHQHTCPIHMKELTVLPICL